MSGLVVIGNLSLDRVDGGPVQPGGCPSFAALGLRMLGGGGRVLTRCAEADQHVFAASLAELGVPVTLLPAATTSAFGLRYHGEQRTMTVDAVGDAWTPADVAELGGDVRWVHVAPLLRSDFRPDTLAVLARNGRQVSFDGQGLVRVPCTGSLVTDASFDPALLASVQALKLAEDEAAIVAGGRFDETDAAALGVPEVLLTLGSEGSVVYTNATAVRVPAAWPVLGVQTTGAGDVFMVGYGAARIRGADPVEAARSASELVARMLEERKRAMIAVTRPRATRA